MSKKFTTLLMVMVAMLLAIPSQAQETSLARKATTSVSKRGVQLRQKSQKMTAVGNKDAVQKVTGAKVDGKAFEVFAPQQVSTRAKAQAAPETSDEVKPVSQTFSTRFMMTNMSGRPFHNTHAGYLMQQYAQSSSPTRAMAPRKAATTDEYGIITAPEEGESKYYTRSGTGYYIYNGQVYYDDQDGVVEIVEGNDGYYYIKDIISFSGLGTWVKATKSGNTLTVAPGQPIDYYLQYSTTLSVFWADFDSEGNATKDATSDITFTIDGNTITLNGSSEDRAVCMMWDDDDSWSGYGDYETVWTLDESFEPGGTDLVELPAGATPEQWYAEGSGSATAPANMNVALVGSNVYVQGLVSQFPNAWIKGTIAGSTATFSGKQFIGQSGNYNIWVIGADANSGGLLPAFTMTYNEAAQTFTLDEGQLILANAADDRMYYLGYLSELTLYKEKPAAAQIDQLPYSNGFSSSEQKEFTIIDANQDGSSWQYYNDVVRYQWSSANQGDDWLVSPAIKLVAGKKYHFSISAHSQQANYPERLEVKAATENTAAALSAGIEVVPNTEIAHPGFKDYENNEFTVSESGYYFFGIHAISDADQWYLTVDDFLLEAAPLAPPYTADFTTEDAMGDFSVLDNNGDDNTWTWSAANYAFYRYSSSTPGDDYLILPIRLQAGKNYSVVVEAAAQSESYAERFEVVAGTDGETFPTSVISPTELTNRDFTEFEGNLTAENDGVYYIAIHAISDADKYFLKVKRFTVEEAASGLAPAVAQAFTAEAGAEGALYVDLAFTAPQTNIEGSALEGPLVVDIYRNDEIVASMGEVAVGASNTYRDVTVEDATDYTYYIIYTNAYGKGVKSEKIQVRVGQDDLADVTGIEVTGETATQFTMTWDEVEGLNGGYVDKSNVIYTVYTLEPQSFWGFVFYEPVDELATVTGATTATIPYNVDEGEQTYLYLGVSAKTEGGEETDASAEPTTLFVGAPYELPLEENFEGKTFHSLFLDNGNAYFAVSEDASDDDGVALALAPYYESGEVTLETGKLNIETAANPTLLFDLKNMQGSVTSVDIFGIKSDGSTVALQTAAVPDEYETVKVPLASLKGDPRFVRVGISAIMNEAYDEENEVDNSDYILIDNIKVIDLYQYDLSVSLKANATVKAGENATITATVKNEGENAVSGYTVTVKADGETLLEETVSETLEAFKTREFTATLTTTKFDDAADLTIEATVAYDNDLNPENDEASTIISIKESTAAQPENVTAEQTEEGITITWSTPTSGAGKDYTETFEEGDGGWSFIDSDGDGYNWILFSNVGLTSGGRQAHEGDCLVYSQSYDNDFGALTPDNWLVSPKAILNGTFSFWAAAQDENYSEEHFAVYVSTTSATDVSTFVKVSDEFIATGEYKEYSVDLSSYAGQEGWIAIRHFNCTDMFELVVDDITYQVASGEAESYNIYVDGELVGNTNDTTYDYTGDLSDGDHEVAVSAVYEGGAESKPVITTVSVVSGIEQISVEGKPVDIYSLDGKLVRQQATDLNGLKGIYVVGNKKVIIR